MAVIKKILIILFSISFCGCSNKINYVPNQVSYFGYDLVNQSLFNAEYIFYFYDDEGNVLDSINMKLPSDISYSKYLYDEDQILMYALGGLVQLDTSNMRLKVLEKEKVITSATAYKDSVYAVEAKAGKDVTQQTSTIYRYHEDKVTFIADVDSIVTDLIIYDDCIYVSAETIQPAVAHIYKYSLDGNLLSKNLFIADGYFNVINGQVYLSYENGYKNLETNEIFTYDEVKFTNNYVFEIKDDIPSYLEYHWKKDVCIYTYGSQNYEYDNCNGFQMNSPNNGVFVIDNKYYLIDLLSQEKTKIPIKYKISMKLFKIAN